MIHSSPSLLRLRLAMTADRKDKIMKLVLIFASIGLMWSGAALAQEGYPPECRILPDHRAANDVTYQPGVDVRGKAVVPADINAAPVGLGKETVVVPLTVDLAQKLQNQNIEGLELKGTLGFLEIAPSGRVTYNGQDLTSQVHALCGEKPGETAPLPPSKPDRQTAPDVIESAPVKENTPKPPAPKPVPASKPVAPPEPEQGELLEGGEYAE
jgi:hypothetical protein